MSVSGTALAAPLQCMDLLRVGLDANADDIALVSSSTHWTWRELDDASSRLAANLLNFGLQRGDRVASEAGASRVGGLGPDSALAPLR